ncbi:MAG: DUF4838 domain-containing protein [Armatimonadetes bacterium]|nr:DUF4838 domain-containing protein [Armatimonadota bacterium]
MPQSGTSCYWLAVFLILPQATSFALPLFTEGQSASPVSIVHAPDAPPSVIEAAREVQRVILASTGARLEIKQEPTEPMICLGQTPWTVQSGITTQGLADDGFIIRTVGPNVFIAGKDYPADKPPWAGWHSRGTLFGAYDFLERVVGVRWLLPGEVGEDIPVHKSLGVPEMDLTCEPDFPIRLITDVQDQRPPGDKAPSQPLLWLHRNKIPSKLDGRKLQHTHSWGIHISQELASAHPEWLAKDEAGNPRTFSRHSAVKYCTSNTDMLDAFAEGVCRWLEKFPSQRSAPISPSDGGDFCLCPACQALVTTDPHGRPSYTNLILRFYNDIARRVKTKYPDRLLAGYVYYNYMYPPSEAVAMEPNVVLVWAPLNYYGRGLQKPVYKEEHRRVLDDWLRVTPNFVLHNYSTWMRAFNGTPLPPALDILKQELPNAHAAGAIGADMIGLGAWGYGGPTNYILARQMWDVSVDVDALFVEWLQRAYGPGWEPMYRMYMMLEERMRDWKQAESPVYQSQMYEINYELVDTVYKPVFPEMERLYLEAIAKVETDKQRRRLLMFGDNLIQLHWSMRAAGMISEPFDSAFYRTDEEYQQFLADTEFSLSLYRNDDARYTGPLWKGEWSR